MLLPPETRGTLSDLADYHEVDRAVYSAFGLKDAEPILIQDLFDVTVPDFKGNESSPGRQPTDRGESSLSGAGDPELRGYCDHFIRVLRAGFGEDKKIKATIFQGTPQHRLPVRLVAFHLDWPNRTNVKVERVDSPLRRERLKELDNKFIRGGKAESGGIFFQRIARIYDVYEHNGKEIPTIYIAKPDRLQYWTRSVAMRDAGEVAADMETWMQRQSLSPVAD